MAPAGSPAEEMQCAGLTGPVGAGADAKRVRTLRIEESGVYENILVDGEWNDEDLARIRADNVVLRNCTLRNGRRDALEIYARNVRVENDIAFRCRGSLGSARVTARNCTVYHTSRVFRLEQNVQNVKIFHLALGEGIGELYDRAPGPGARCETEPEARRYLPVSISPCGSLHVGPCRTSGCRR